MQDATLVDRTILPTPVVRHGTPLRAHLLATGLATLAAVLAGQNVLPSWSHRPALRWSEQPVDGV